MLTTRIDARGWAVRGALLVAVSTSLASCGGDSTSTDMASDPLQLGSPPTVAWPSKIACPASLVTLCAGDDMRLVGTVNLERESAITALTFGTEASVLCRWPLNDKACDEIGPNGAVVEGEAAVYARSVA